ncbi:RidA family protein [uncultured Helicobacter sp.]|uniref:RidA family protein n=1 Tax=uncultured Helicobacter sp. TaxID=175537 RepID=UPI00374E9245
MQPIFTPNAPEAIGPYSQAIVHNGLVYTSGQIALNAQGVMSEGDVEAQTKQVFMNLKAILEQAGSSLQKVIKTSVFLSDMEHFNAMNAVYAEYFGNHKPARSTIAVKTLPKNALVEIECIAAI